MSTFDENKEAIERNVEEIIAASNELTAEIARAVSVENEFTSQITSQKNKTPFMYATELVDTSDLTEDYVGRVYLLLSSYDNYENGHAYKVVSLEDGYGYTDITKTDIHLENVTHLRYIEKGDDAYIWWNDPEDIILQGEVISKWAGTKLVYKSYDSLQTHETSAYPQNINDGNVLVESTVRNQYSTTPYIADGLDALKVYYCRLFPYTESGDAMLTNPELNSFKLNTYDWNQFEKLLEEYPTYRDHLPKVGSAVVLKYIEGDYYSSGGSTVNTHTRASVLSSLDKLSTINTNWLVLGYNAHTPQFVKYRRPIGNADDEMYDYVYVSTVNDGTHEVGFVDLQGDFTNREVLSGDMLLKTEIAVGDRVYRKEYDEIADKPIYYYANAHISAISDTSSTSGGFTYGSVDTFTVPTKITVEGYEYDFCGYNMTVHSQNLLTGAKNAGVDAYKDIQFDASEPVNANACNIYDTFDDISSDSDYGYYYDEYGYYYINNGAYTAIDVVGESLGGQPVQYYNGSGNVVYKAYVPEHPFYDSHKRPIPFIEQETETYKISHVYLNSSGVTLSAGTDYTVGDVILASDNIYERGANGHRYYGCNMYEQSFIRQQINNTLGSADSWWKKQNRWDVKSTTGWAYNNGVLLKLKREADFIKSIIPVVNKTILSETNYMYARKWLNSENFYFDYIIDRMFLLSTKEVNLKYGLVSPEAASVFSEVYPDNISRQKRLYQVNGDLGSTYNWWLRSPFYMHSFSNYGDYTEAAVAYDGADFTSGAYNNYGCAPACVIG